MKRARFAIFAIVLGVAIVAVVGTVVAQGPAPPFTDGQGGPRARARAMMLDGRGSRIGVMVDDLTPDDLKALTGATSGVRVQNVDEDSPAAKAGLRAGDVVVEFDGEKIRSARQFSRLVEETVGGRAVKLGILRSGERQTLDVTPESRTFGWSIDGDRIGRDIARSLRELEPRLREIEPRLREIEPRLRELEPRLREMEPWFREFRFEGPTFDFDFDDFLPGSVRGRLGVQVESLSPQLAEYFGVKDGGALVSSVTTDSPADKAGLKAGDVITSIDGNRVRDQRDLINAFRDKAGEITIGIVRDKKESTVKTSVEPRQSRTRRPVRGTI
jgi:serine protease Do